MSSKIKNIIILVGVALVLIFVYFYFFAGKKDQPLISNSPSATTTGATTSNEDTSAISQELLSVLLNIKNIKIDNSIFSSKAFSSLRDSSVEIVPDGQEGRVNPFAPIGSDPVVETPNTNIQTTDGTMTPDQASPDLSNGATGNTVPSSNTITTDQKNTTNSKIPKTN